MVEANSIPASRLFSDKTGKTIGRLFVIEFAGIVKSHAYWRCRCKCGKECVVRIRGGSQTCGWKCGNTTHGHAPQGKPSPEYVCWKTVIARCTKPEYDKFRFYGGRGIRVCERWRDSFEAFLADMGPRPSRKHSIDRKNNDGNYEPGNCRWATRVEQCNNRRSNRLLSLNGETHTMAEWTRKTGMKKHTIYRRLKAGWTVERAITEPVRDC